MTTDGSQRQKDQDCAQGVEREESEGRRKGRKEERKKRSGVEDI